MVLVGVKVVAEGVIPDNFNAKEGIHKVCVQFPEILDEKEAGEGVNENANVPSVEPPFVLGGSTSVKDLPCHSVVATAKFVVDFKFHFLKKKCSNKTERKMI